MFEEAAEELFKKKPLGYEMKPELEIYTDGYKDGYNKAKEEDKALIEKMKSIHNCKYGAYMVGCTLDNKGCRAKDGCEKWEITEK